MGGPYDVDRAQFAGEPERVVVDAIAPTMNVGYLPVSAGGGHVAVTNTRRGMDQLVWRDRDRRARSGLSRRRWRKTVCQFRRDAQPRRDRAVHAGASRSPTVGDRSRDGRRATTPDEPSSGHERELSDLESRRKPHRIPVQSRDYRVPQPVSGEC